MTDGEPIVLRKTSVAGDAPSTGPVNPLTEADRLSSIECFAWGSRRSVEGSGACVQDAPLSPVNARHDRDLVGHVIPRAK
jgi:hypothetical protein